MKTIAIIPARGGSKRLPGKNLQLLGGIPLLVHSIRYAKAQEPIQAVYVSTDDSAIKEVALGYGALVVDRPIKISGDEEPTITAVQHVLQSIHEKVENVVLLQPTNPLRPKNLFAKAWELYQEKGVNGLFTVTKNTHKLGKIGQDRFEPYNYAIGQRSQDLEPLFYENGLLYLTKVSSILQGEIIPVNAYPMEVEHPFGKVDIDTQEDLDYARFLWKKEKA